MSETSSEVKSPIKKLKEEVKKLEETVAKLVARVDNLEEKKKGKENQPPSVLNSNYNNKRNAYINKLNNKDILNPKEETKKYYEVQYDPENEKYY